MDAHNQSSREHQSPSMRRNIPAVLLITLVILLTSLAATYTRPVAQTDQSAANQATDVSPEIEATLQPYPVESAPAATGIILGAAFLVLVILIGTLAATRRRKE